MPFRHTPVRAVLLRKLPIGAEGASIHPGEVTLHQHRPLVFEGLVAMSRCVPAAQVACVRDHDHDRPFFASYAANPNSELRNGTADGGRPRFSLYVDEASNQQGADRKVTRRSYFTLSAGVCLLGTLRSGNHSVGPVSLTGSREPTALDKVEACLQVHSRLFDSYVRYGVTSGSVRGSPRWRRPRLLSVGALRTYVDKITSATSSRLLNGSGSRTA